MKHNLGFFFFYIGENITKFQSKTSVSLKYFSYALLKILSSKYCLESEMISLRHLALCLAYIKVIINVAMFINLVGNTPSATIAKKKKKHIKFLFSNVNYKSNQKNVSTRLQNNIC